VSVSIAPYNPVGWWVIQECPLCGRIRSWPLSAWLSFPIYRKLRSYCGIEGKDVFMRNIGWSDYPIGKILL